MLFAAAALPLAIGAAGADAACQWTHRAGMPYIACDAAPVGLHPPEATVREAPPAPDVLPPPLPETPPQPPIAGTPAAPLGPTSGRPDQTSLPAPALARPEVSAPSLNRHPPPGLLDRAGRRFGRRSSALAGQIAANGDALVSGAQMVPAAGFEPATYRLQGGCSTD